jgi:glycosyltransferase involved in cell wall biosynthesis
MNKSPTVGVVIPVRDGERWLGEALESVLTQTHPPDDVVVVDDGSSDRSAALAGSYGAAVRVLRQEPQGLGTARNHGLDHVRGELVTLVDADDLLTARSLEWRVAVLRARPEIDLVFGHQRRFARIAGGRPVALDEPRAACSPSAMLVRRAAFHRVGPFLVGVRVSDALDWLLRAREQGLCEWVVPEHVLWRRVHATNLSRSLNAHSHELAQALKASLDRRRGPTGALARDVD